MEKVRPRCGQPSDRGRLKNRAERRPTQCSSKLLNAVEGRRLTGAQWWWRRPYTRSKPHSETWQRRNEADSVTRKWPVVTKTWRHSLITDLWQVPATAFSLLGRLVRAFTFNYRRRNSYVRRRSGSRMDNGSICKNTRIFAVMWYQQLGVAQTSVRADSRPTFVERYGRLTCAQKLTRWPA